MRDGRAVVKAREPSAALRAGAVYIVAAGCSQEGKARKSNAVCSAAPVKSHKTTRPLRCVGCRKETTEARGHTEEQVS